MNYPICLLYLHKLYFFTSVNVYIASLIFYTKIGACFGIFLIKGLLIFGDFF